MIDKDNGNIKVENIKNSNKIKASENFSWGGNTVQWQEESHQVASRHKSYKGYKKNQ